MSEKKFNVNDSRVAVPYHTGWETMGYNQQIRKMFDAFGHSVVKLKRTAIGSINYDRLPVGAYRELDAEEIENIANPVKQPKIEKPKSAVKPQRPKQKRLYSRKK